MTPEATLCAACGMCCDGTLFAHGVLDPGEEEPPGASAAWLEETRCFAQPCPQLAGGCLIHEDRPASCRAFRCGVLQDLSDDRLDPAAAQARIAEVRAVVDDLARLLGVCDGVYAAAKALLARRDAAANSQAFDVRHEETLLKIAAFSAISTRYMLLDRIRHEHKPEGAEDD